MAGLRRVLGFVLPSLVAACAGAAVAGLLEGLLWVDGAVDIFAAAGFTAAMAVPIGLASGLIGRGLWHAWRPLVRARTEETGGAPAVAGWLAFALIAVWLIWATSFNAIRLLDAATNQRDVLALASAIVIGSMMALVLIASGPAARGLAAIFRAIDRSLHASLGRSLLTPRWIAGWTIGTVALFFLVGWFVSIRPRIGHLAITPLFYLLLAATILVAVTLAWPRIRRRRALAIGLSVVSLGLVAASGAAATFVRYQRPLTMLDIWGGVPIAGGAVDRLWDVQGMRVELDLPEIDPVPLPGADHPDIVLVTIDTVRADHVGLYGGGGKMPSLASVGYAGAVFDWAIAPGNVTRRSLPSIALGLSPNRIRGRVAGWALRMDPRHITLAERLRAGGYETAGFFCCGSQFARRHRLGLVRGIDHIQIHIDGNEVTRMATEWLRQRRERGATGPLFLWVHYIEPHNWVDDYPRKDHGGDLDHRYNMALNAVDTMLGDLLKEAWPKSRRDDTVVIVTSDHGEGLGDHGQKFHSSDLYNSQIHVPLVIAAPGIEPVRLSRPVDLVSLAPTIMELAGFRPPGMPEMGGSSLLPLMRGVVPDDREQGVAFSAMIPDRSVEREMRAVVHGRYKLIEKQDGAVYELYDLVKDRHERRNLARKEPEVVERLKAQLEAEKKREQVSPFRSIQ